MTNQFSKIFFSVLIFSCIFGCKSITQQGPVEANVYFRYLEPTLQIHSEVSFFKQKTPPTHQEWDNVLFVNIPMKGRAITENQFRYTVDLTKQEFSSEFPIKFWNKGDEMPQEIKIKPQKVNSFSLKNTDSESTDYISKDSDIILSFDAPSFSERNRVTLLFTNEKNESVSIVVNEDLSGGKAVLPKNTNSKIPTGNCKVEMISTSTENLDTDGLKATILSEFYSKGIEITIK